jgi:hypothetical protein
LAVDWSPAEKLHGKTGCQLKGCMAKKEAEEMKIDFLAR